MRVALVGSVPHMKHIGKRLQDAGYAVEYLGGGAGLHFPVRFDCIVCRVSASSHDAVDACHAAQREGRPVVFVTGVHDAVGKVEQAIGVPAPPEKGERATFGGEPPRPVAKAPSVRQATLFEPAPDPMSSLKEAILLLREELKKLDAFEFTLSAGKVSIKRRVVIEEKFEV